LDGERFNLRKLHGLEIRQLYQIEITNRFAALENLSDNEDINRAWENIKENIKTSAKDSLDNVDNLNTVRHDASRHFRNKKKAYLKAKIEELEINSKIKNIRDLYRGINDFKKGYQPRANIVKDDKGDLVADSHSILARWRNYFFQILKVHGVNDVRQT